MLALTSLCLIETILSRTSWAMMTMVAGLRLLVNTADSFENYVEKLRNSSMWGGEVEIQALCAALRVRVSVFAADRVHDYGGDGPQLRVTYHRKAYALGEHYNSVRDKAAERWTHQ
jgi:hypothetical protein